MLSGKKNVLEVGCGDADGMPIVLQEVSSVHGIDIDEFIINDAKKRFLSENIKGTSFSLHDVIKNPLNTLYDAAFSLDVIEHIPNKDEEEFVANIASSLTNDGVFIIGTPNKTADQYASEGSRKSHINLQSHESLKNLMMKSFVNVFCFSMNDEVVHTGFNAMAHYIIVMGVGRY